MASGSVGSRDAAGLVLEAGDVRATLLPEDGGRVGSLVIGGHEVILGGDPDRMRWGSYPMAPFAGRIRHGRFSFRGRDHQLPLGHAAARHPRRGVGPAVAGRRRDDALDRPRRPLAVPGSGRPAVRAGRGLDDVRAHPRGGRADARHDRLAPLVPADPRARRPAGGRRLRRRRDARPGRRGPAHGRAGRAAAGPVGRRVHRRPPRPGADVAGHAATHAVVDLPVVGRVHGARRTRCASSPRAGRPTPSTARRTSSCPAGR